MTVQVSGLLSSRPEGCNYADRNKEQHRKESLCDLEVQGIPCHEKRCDRSCHEKKQANDQTHDYLPQPASALVQFLGDEGEGGIAGHRCHPKTHVSFQLDRIVVGAALERLESMHAAPARLLRHEAQ